MMKRMLGNNLCALDPKATLRVSECILTGRRSNYKQCRCIGHMSHDVVVNRIESKSTANNVLFFLCFFW